MNLLRFSLWLCVVVFLLALTGFAVISVPCARFFVSFAAYGLLLHLLLYFSHTRVYRVGVSLFFVFVLVW